MGSTLNCGNRSELCVATWCAEVDCEEGREEGGGQEEAHLRGDRDRNGVQAHRRQGGRGQEEGRDPATTAVHHLLLLRGRRKEARSPSGLLQGPKEVCPPVQEQGVEDGPALPVLQEVLISPRRCLFMLLF